MKYIIDMVHHNPGEREFETAFNNAQHVADYGYTHQCIKHINCAITFDALGEDILPEGSPDREWVLQLQRTIDAQIEGAKNAGVGLVYHIDMFVLPKLLVQKYKDEILDDKGKIDINKEMTQKLHTVMFDELFSRFPYVEGLIIRIGETYLYDTPYHTGNGVVIHKYGLPKDAPKDYTDEIARITKAVNMLREIICVRNNKVVMFRTWDVFPDKFHASVDYYLKVTDNVEPHENLIFSIKHTKLDFLRWAKFNECITKGKHKQIIEAQCQREYEGKGAHPNYVAQGIIESFEENAVKKGLRDVINHPLVVGLYTWSRGGGWYGPMPANELWCDLNAYVLAQFVKDPTKTEREIFNQYAKEKLKLNEVDTQILHKALIKSLSAILKGKYCTAFDITLEESFVPTGFWIRDDRLGGINQLREVFDYIYDENLYDDMMSEKYESVKIWQEICDDFEKITMPNQDTYAFIKTSAKYGKLLYEIIAIGWDIAYAVYTNERGGVVDKAKLKTNIDKYYAVFSEYNNLPNTDKFCSTLYKGVYFGMPGETPAVGMDDTVEIARGLL